eukprot:TRINITY_DN20411_c0_g1_i1.p1 TRINITY_DN20411_c0_g1~~TRINITY_DN20411_c0_g1_i1.p1  ORF type:complete len:237 (-),score=29.24 TRINITY_DN20411_c0_g1_i1:163-873(-)
MEYGTSRISLETVAFFVGDRLGLAYDMDDQVFIDFEEPVPLSHTGRRTIGSAASAATSDIIMPFANHMELVSRWVVLLDRYSKNYPPPSSNNKNNDLNGTHSLSMTSHGASITFSSMSLGHLQGDDSMMMATRGGGFRSATVQSVCASMAITALNEALLHGEITDMKEYKRVVSDILRLRIPYSLPGGKKALKALLKEPEFALPFVVLGGHCPELPSLAERAVSYTHLTLPTKRIV